jgi:hypothetical protein
MGVLMKRYLALGRLQRALFLALLACASIILAYYFEIPERKLAAAVVLIVCSCALLSSNRIWRLYRQIDWKLKAILIATLASILITLGIFALGIGRDPATLFGAIFAAWVGGVAFFTLVGVVVSIVSLAEADHEAFDARARILFRGKTGLHIDYIAERIKSIFEHYAEETNTLLAIEEYHQGEKSYLLSIEDITTIRAYIDDIESTYNSKINMSEVTACPVGAAPNRLVYLRTDNQPSLDEVFVDKIDREFQTKIAPGSACKVEHKMDIWMKATDEVYDHEPARYTQKLSLDVENRLSGKKDVTIKFLKIGTSSWDTFQLRAGERRNILALRELRPRQLGYSFVILPP